MKNKVKLFSPAKFAATEAGFTLVELLVTLAILALFYGLVLTNFASWRAPQYVKNAANELATTVNKIRSYALSARNLEGNPAKLYVVQVTTNQSDYRVQGLVATSTGDVFKDPVEKLTLPGLVYVQDIALTSTTGAVTHPTCIQIAFGLPFGKAYMNPACDFNQPKSLSQLDALSNQQVSITLTKTGTNTTRIITLDGVSGRVTVQ